MRLPFRRALEPECRGIQSQLWQNKHDCLIYLPSLSSSGVLTAVSPRRMCKAVAKVLGVRVNQVSTTSNVRQHLALSQICILIALICCYHVIQTHFLQVWGLFKLTGECSL